MGVVERAWINRREGKATIRFPREGLDKAVGGMFGLISDCITIYDPTGRLRLEHGFAEDLVGRGLTVDASRRLIPDHVAARSDETHTFSHVSIVLGGRDECMTRRDAVATGNLCHRPICATAPRTKGPSLLSCEKRCATNLK